MKKLGVIPSPSSMAEPPPSPPLPPPQPQILSPCSNGRRSSATSSPEFEFWKLRNPSEPQHELLSADQLFLNGVLVPLHLLSLRNHPEEPPDTSDPEPPPLPQPEPNSNPNLNNSNSPLIISDSTTATSNSKRWRDIFKRSEKKDKDNDKDSKLETEKESSSISSNNNNNGGKKKSEKRNTPSSGTSSAEININIWPFSRSRSAGNGATRPRLVFGSSGSSTRKVSSAPCSRSNSSGDSKSRKWPSSPGRAGVHLGRNTPVWKLRRGSSAVQKGGSEVVNGVSSEKGVGKKECPDSRRSKAEGGGGGGGAGSSGATPKAKVLNLSVPVCIGYRHHLSCRSDGNGDVFVAGSRSSGGGGGGGEGGAISGDVGTGSGGGNSGNYFNFRSLFTKKVH